MAYAYKCDRCGKYFDKFGVPSSLFKKGTTSVLSGVVIKTTNDYAVKSANLCETCWDGLSDFFKNEKPVPPVEHTTIDL